MRLYTAHVYREGKWWLIALPGVAGVAKARRLADVEMAARRYLRTKGEPEDAEIVVRTVIDRVGELTDIGDRALRIRHLRADSERARAEVIVLATELAQQLAQAHVPVRDIGTILGISHQRAGQLVNE